MGAEATSAGVVYENHAAICSYLNGNCLNC
jgi:hypothetical protein